MSDAQGTSFVTGWGYWPSSDIYSLTPIWLESHTPQGITVDAKEEEAITQNVRIDYGMPWSLVVSLTDLGTDLKNAADDTLVTSFVRVESFLQKQVDWGFAKKLAFDTTIADDGTITLAIPPSMHDTLGLNQPWIGIARAVLENTADGSLFAVKILFATITVIA